MRTQNLINSNPNAPWDHISMDFMIDLLKSQRGVDFIFVVVDQFSKIVHFIPCKKTMDAYYITNFYFNEVIKLHRIPKSIEILNILVIFRKSL